MAAQGLLQTLAKSVVGRNELTFIHNMCMALTIQCVYKEELHRWGYHETKGKTA